MTSPAYAFSDPIAQGDPVFGRDVPIIDYSAFDYETIKRFLVQLASQRFGENYNNFVESDVGIMLIELMAARGDLLSLKLDMSINEAFASTALLDKNIRRHARRRSYIPTPLTAARYDIVASVVKPYDVDVIIPPGYQISVGGSDARLLSVELYLADENGDPLYDQDIIVPAGISSISNIVGIEGQSRSIDSEGTGQSGQTIIIPDTNVITSDVEVEVDGTPWERVESLYLGESKNIFKVDQDDRGLSWYVIFGNGTDGSVVPSGARIIVRYRVGGGARGNVPAGFINIAQNIAVPGAGITASISFTNRTKGYGGGDAETVAEIQKNLAEWDKTQGVLSTLNSYTLEGSRFYSGSAGRVAKARAYLRHAGCSANVVDIYVLELSTGGQPAPPSDRLIRGLREHIEDMADCAQHVCVRPGSVVYLDIRVHIVMPISYASKKPLIESRIRQAIDVMFQLKNWNMGVSLSPSQISKRLPFLTNIGVVEVDLSTYPGYDLEDDGSYKARHYELIRPKIVEIAIDFSRDVTGAV